MSPWRPWRELITAQGVCAQALLAQRIPYNLAKLGELSDRIKRASRQVLSPPDDAQSLGAQGGSHED